MDLPTCPSCGQSVLDDEPVSCPFCGAAMDGSSGPDATRKPAPVKTKKTPVRKPQQGAIEKAAPAGAKEKEQDPFDIASSPQARRAIACSPKRTKSRPVRVICPMCDTRGYVPRTAIGRQVKCSNSTCMVPLFTAPDPHTTKTPASPGRMSDQVAQQEEQLARPARPRSPTAMYAILGGVLLLAGLALKFYLDREPDDDKFNNPIGIPLVETVDEDVEQTSREKTPPTAGETLDKRVIISRLANQMIQSAQMSLNRDKALCRRLTGDAFLRLGDEERARQEFDQLLVVSRQRKLVSDYYRISPLARNFWKAVALKDQATADDLYSRMKPDAETIPPSGLLAIEAAVKWGAILVQRQELQQAQELTERLKIDDSVRLQVDRLHRGVWAAITVSAAEAEQQSGSPIAQLIWTNPVATAIAVELALQKQWEPAISWAELWNDLPVQSDLFAEISRQAVRSTAPSSVIERVQEAAAHTGPVQRRVEAVLAESSDDLLQTAVASLPTAEITALSEMLPLTTVLSNRRPDLAVDHDNARLFMELARSAAARTKTEIAAAAIIGMYDSLRTTLPPTALVREASLELDQSAASIRERLRNHLGKPDTANISPDFSKYRRGLDWLAAAAEERRLLLIRMLCGVVERDGGKSLNLALEQSKPLAEELKLDPLCQLVAGEAILAGGSVPALTDVTAVVIPRGQRTKAQQEDALATIWLATVQASRQNYDTTLLKSFESTLSLPGLQSCLQRRIAESRANQAELKILDAAAAMKNVVCRENSLWTAAAWLGRSGQRTEAEEWTRNRRLSATDRVLTMSGIITSLDSVDTPDD